MRFECCGYCEKRRPGCHGKCPEYLEEKEKFEKAKARRVEEKRKAYDVLVVTRSSRRKEGEF